MRKILSSRVLDEPYGSPLQLNYPPPPIERRTDASPSDSEAPKANNIVFFFMSEVFLCLSKDSLAQP